MSDHASPLIILNLVFLIVHMQLLSCFLYVVSYFVPCTACCEPVTVK